MHRIAIAILAGLLPLPVLTAAQDTRITVIRDDDGTADDGRGQVTSDRSVCRKTLLLDADPATVTRAWVQYFMKVRPYDVATRKLYDGPVEGVEWADLVIAVNGAEVLRDSLIDHGTMGWHELEIDPDVLVRGPNQITLTLDRGGSYFYLGIDRDNNYGRSASSRDGGQTWREGWLSFGTEEPDAGEYMVRLKIEAPAAEPVGFLERDGRLYGWLEMEDLFSPTEAHASGFKSIEYDHGVNQPSGGRLAWGPAGRFSFPIEIPADRQWRLLLRAWVDGFRGGRFTLGIDGRQLYDSAGHEFTSDTGLRLDWLDMGAVHLGEGRHVIEIATEGDCGHMLDVLVLTTDAGYVPDEAQPLPRMTTVASLVAAPGLSDLQPGLFMTTDPILWAKPLAGGPLRTLWVCGDINEREIVELQQRIDMEAQVISSPTNYFGENIFGSDLSLDQGDLLYELLAGDEPPDVLVLVRTNLDQVPSHALEALLTRVEAGMGLIVCRSRREQQPNALTALIDQAEPLEMASLAAPAPLGALERIRLTLHGQGRIVVMPYSLWGTMGRIADAHTLRYPYWEYQFARWLKMLMTAGARDAALIGTVACAETVAPGEAPTATVTCSGDVAAVRGAWLAPFAAPVALEPVAVADGQATIPLPASAQDGLHHVALTLVNAAGDAVDVASAQYQVLRPARIAQVEASCTDDGAEVLATATVEGAPSLPVEAEVYGAHARLIGRAQGTIGGDAELRVPLIASGERIIELRLTVPDEGASEQHLRRLLTRPQPVVIDDYIPYSGLWENREAPDYCQEAYARIWEQMGFRAIQPSGVVWHSLDQGFLTAQPYRLTGVGSATVTPEGERVPCLHDPELWAREEPSIREQVRARRPLSPLLLGLGDEMQVASREACFSEHTRAAFREWLRGRYASLDELNATWGTNFASWNRVEPWRIEQARQRPDNIAPWLEFRKFMADTFVGAIERMQGWAQEEAGDTVIGGVNPWDEGWTTCTVMSKLFPILEYGQIYPRSHDRARSWFRDPKLIGMWSGYGRPRKQVEREGWLLPAYGGTFMGWYGVGRELGYGTLTGTLNLGPRAEWISAVNHELTSGVGRLLIESEPVQEPVAILHSWPSRCAYVAAMGAEEPNTPADALDQRWEECEETFVRLLRRLRIPYRFVDEDQIAEGYLQEREVDMLIAPRAWALSDATLEAIAAFAADHPVVADSRLGQYDERGHKRNETPIDGMDVTVWDDLPAPLSDETIARLREQVQSQFPAGTEYLKGDVSFWVARQFGDAQMTVAFGTGELTVANLPAGTFAYDAREHRALGQATEARAQMEHGPAVLVFSDDEIAGLDIAATGASLGATVRYDLSLGTGNDTVARVSVIGPDGEERPWYAANVRLTDGVGAGSFTPALNDPPGAWTLRALDVLTGETAEATVEVQ